MKETVTISKEEYDSLLALKNMKETVTISKEEYDSLLALKNTKETATISKEEYESLLEDSDMLLALQGAGVDNWGGYDEAMQLFNEMKEEGEENDYGILFNCKTTSRSIS
jgi:hypothetical protein